MPIIILWPQRSVSIPSGPALWADRSRAHDVKLSSADRTESNPASARGERRRRPTLRRWYAHEVVADRCGDHSRRRCQSRLMRSRVTGVDLAHGVFGDGAEAGS